MSDLPCILFPMRDRPIPGAYRSVLKLHFVHGWGLIENDLPHHFEVIRGRLGTLALETRHEWFVWWDDDVPASPEQANTLFTRARALANATKEKHIVMTAIFRPGKLLRIEDLEPDEFIPRGLVPHQGIQQASHLGFAMVCMHRSVLEDMPHRTVEMFGVRHGTWFHGVYEDDLYFTETGAFSYRMIKAGWPMWCDTETFVPHGMPSLGGD